MATCTPTTVAADGFSSPIDADRTYLPDSPQVLLAQRPPRFASLNAGRSIDPAMTDDAYLAVNAGLVGLFNRFKETLRYGMEYRWKPHTKLRLRPAAGLITAENDASYLFFGIRRDFHPATHWVVTGSFDAGYFEERERLKLGLQLEFRTGLELAYQLGNRYRLGMALYHLSNGGFGERNPGTESAVVNLTIPIQ
ncbi:acyloxyacyl hydrolase [Litorivivens sp.]|uniref:acyloxyacyl hydrolase n=1 Tax=Litorivivens sp. TaxID=2020868 RepID=UPI0035695480